MISMRFPIMLTKENDKQLKELKKDIKIRIIKYNNCVLERNDFKEKYIMAMESLGILNKCNKDLKDEIKELKRHLENKDKGIVAMKKMLEERTTDNE